MTTGQWVIWIATGAGGILLGIGAAWVVFWYSHIRYCRVTGTEAAQKKEAKGAARQRKTGEEA